METLLSFFCKRSSHCLFSFSRLHSFSPSLIPASKQSLSISVSRWTPFNSSSLANMPSLSVIIKEDRLRPVYKKSTNAEVEMSSGLVIEPLSTGCTPITYYSASNNEVKHECDLGRSATLREGRGRESQKRFKHQHELWLNCHSKQGINSFFTATGQTSQHYVKQTYSILSWQGQRGL